MKGKGWVPGQGIRSMDSSNVFKIANFELFVKPNKYVMGAGICALSLCFGYIFYMNFKVRTDSTNRTYIALNEDNTETIQTRKSKWD